MTQGPSLVRTIVAILGAVACAALGFGAVATFRRVLPIVIAVIDRLVIAREERYLAAAFPSAYAEYRARVRGWR